MSLKKAKTIAKAFLTPLPVGEKWYEDRLEICKTCPKNSGNVDESKLSFIDKAKIASNFCDEGNHCLACGCCIERKAATKSEECGLGEVGEVAKWPALEVPGVIDKNLSIINLTPDMGDVGIGTREFTYEFFVDKFDKKMSFSFQLHRTRGLDVKTYNASCGCTVGEMEIIDDKTVNFSLDISTISFKENLTQRTFTVTYYEKNNKTRDIQIVFKITKSNDK